MRLETVGLRFAEPTLQDSASKLQRRDTQRRRQKRQLRIYVGFIGRRAQGQVLTQVVGWAPASPRCGGLRRTSRAEAHRNAIAVGHSAHRIDQDRMRMIEKPCRILVGQ